METVADRRLAAVVMIDQSAAYDLLDHKLILAKMSLYGLGDSYLGWLGSYLAGRVQTTKVQARTSDPILLGECGAPQGSILAGLLHVISCNDCPSANTEGSSVLFVGDGTDMGTGDSIPELQDWAQRQAMRTCQWMEIT